jgi:hypothetical protein
VARGGRCLDISISCYRFSILRSSPLGSRFLLFGATLNFEMMPMKKILSVLVIFLPVAASAGDWKPCTNGDYIDRHGNRRWHGLPRWALKIDVLHDGSKLDPGDGIWQHASCNWKTHDVALCTPISDPPSERCKKVLEDEGIDWRD